MDNKVVTVEVDATAAGKTLGVQAATLSLAVNEIPTIELSCVPTQASGKPLEPTVCSPTISEFADLYQTLAPYAEGLSETGDVNIKLSGDYNDTLSLKNWVLSGVGLSSISSTGAPHLSVVLQHPICKLTKVGSIYETPMSNIDEALNTCISGASSFIDVVDFAYSCVRDHVQFWPPEDPIATEYRMSLGVGDYDPRKYLFFDNEGGSTGIFLGANAEDAFSRAMAPMVLPTSGGSTWDMIMQSCGALMLSVTQDHSYNFTGDMLKIGPLTPWKKATITLSEDKCAATDVPGMNPFKITGVMARKPGPGADLSVNQGLYDNGRDADEAPEPPSEVMYVPEGVSVDSSDGRIMVTSAPSILDSAFWIDAVMGDDITAGIAFKGLESNTKDDYNEILRKYCKAVFEVTAGSMIQGRAQMALGFKDDDGNLILPGNTCKFMTKSTGNGGKGSRPLYYGYIRRVVHHLSTSGGCGTTVMMSYVRPTENFMINGNAAIKAGSPNAAYT